MGGGGRDGDRACLAVLIGRGVDTQGGRLLPRAAGADRREADRNDCLWKAHHITH